MFLISEYVTDCCDGLILLESLVLLKFSIYDYR